MRDGPLDMRMNTDQPPSAAQWLAQAEESDIANVIFRYGEERFSRRIARLIVERRQESPIETTRQLAELVSQAVPKKENTSIRPPGPSRPSGSISIVSWKIWRRVFGPRWIAWLRAGGWW